MVNYLTDDHWKAFIPQNIQNEIQTKENIEEAIDVFWNDVGTRDKLSKYTNFVEFLEEGRKFTFDHLTNTWIDDIRVRDILSEIGCLVDSEECLNIKAFMTEKKNHEVSNLINIL